MGVLEELKAKYPWHNVPPYGDCVVVGVTDWQEQWDAELRLQNVRSISTTYQAHPVYLIPLKGLPHDMHEPPSPTLSSESLKPTSSIEIKKPTDPRSGRRSDWQPEENERLAKLWKKGIKAPKMVDFFPNRTGKAIRQQLTELIRKGVIKPRWHKRQPEKKPEPGLSENAKSPESIPGMPGNEIRDVLKRLKKLLQETTIHIHDSSKPFTFKWHCSKCGLGGEAKCAEVWRTCQVCGSLLFVWNVD
jgi:hypothetical protein